jgi:hypothetical protein
MSNPVPHGPALRSVWWIPVLGFGISLSRAIYQVGFDFSVTGLVLNWLGNTTAVALVMLVVSAVLESRAAEEGQEKRWALRARGSGILVIIGAALTLLGFVTAVGFGFAF